MAAATELETKLDELFAKKAPKLPAGVKKFIFDWAPWIAVIVGVLSIFSAVSLWSAARGTHYSAYYYQQVCSTYQSDNGHCALPSSASHLTFWLWLAIIFLVIQGFLYIRAYTPLREHRKAGWDLLFYAELTYVAYAIITLLTDYDVVGHFISAAIGIAVSFYILFQVRSLYTGAVAPQSKAETLPTYDKPVADPTPKAEPLVASAAETKPVVITSGSEPESELETKPAPAEIIEPEVIVPTKAPIKPKTKAKTKKKTTKKKPTKKS
jgi:hypothetical protein